MDAFKCFMEDYNTATMPHEKYYNYEKWEMEEYQRQQRRAQKSRDREQVREVFDDEAERRRELKRKRELAEKREFHETLAKISQDKDKRESMRRQDELRAELQLAYKSGDQATVSRLERILAPEEEKVGVRHPWAG